MFVTSIVHTITITGNAAALNVEITDVEIFFPDDEDYDGEELIDEENLEEVGLLLDVLAHQADLAERND